MHSRGIPSLTTHLFLFFKILLGVKHSVNVAKTVEKVPLINPSATPNPLFSKNPCYFPGHLFKKPYFELKEKSFSDFILNLFFLKATMQLAVITLIAYPAKRRKARRKHNKQLRKKILCNHFTGWPPRLGNTRMKDLPPTRDRKGFVHKVTLLSWSLGHLWLRKEIVVDT